LRCAAAAFGWGLPAAIGAKLASPTGHGGRVIGDGSAMYTEQALWDRGRYSGCR